MHFASTNSPPENRGFRVRDGQKPREFGVSGHLAPGCAATWNPVSGHPAPGWSRPETPTWRGRWGDGEDGASMGTHGALGVPEMKECRAIPMGWTIGGAEWVWTPWMGPPPERKSRCCMLFQHRQPKREILWLSRNAKSRLPSLPQL